MPSPCRNTVRVSGGVQGGRIDGGYRLDKDLGPQCHTL
jgi:hypothetical protein